MDRVIKTYKRKGKHDKNTLYLFFVQVPNATRTGFMPLAAPYGFIFNFGSDLNVLAHELAHGTFNLRHTFSDKAQYHFPERSTQNLMDYANGTELWKYQWDLIHNPEKITFAWAQNEDEGAAIDYYSSVKSLKVCHSEKIDELLLKGVNVFYFYPPSDPEKGKIYKIGIDDYSKFDIYIYEYTPNYYSIMPGSIGIIKKDGERYNAAFNVGETNLDEFKFKGYRKKTDEGTEEYYHIDEVSKDDAKRGMQIPYIKVEGDRKYYKLITYDSDYIGFEDIATLVDDCNCFDQIQGNSSGSGQSQTIPLDQGNSDLSVDQVYSLLKGLPKQDGASFEFVQKGNVYYLDEKGKLKERSNPLSSNDLENGNWTDKDDLKVRIGFDESDNLHLYGLGFKKSIVKKGKEDTNVATIAKNLKDDFNKILSDNNIKSNVSPNSNGIDLSGESSKEFPGGGNVTVDGNQTFFTILTDAGNITVDFLKTAEIQQEVYLKNTDATIKIPGIATGAVESAAMVVTDMTSMVCMISDFAFDKSARNEAIDGFVALKNKVAEDPGMLFPMIGNMILEEGLGADTDGFSEAFNDNTDLGRRHHLKSRIAARTTATVIAGGQFLVMLPKMVDEIVMKMLEAKLLKKIKNASGFTDELLSTLKKNLYELLEHIPDATNSLNKIADFASATEFTHIVEKLNRLKKLDGIETLISDMGSYWTKFKGSEFVLDYASKLDEALITGKRVKFEVKELIRNASGDVVDRIYDLTIDGTKYEMKAWSKWQRWSDGVIRKQFVRDLANPSLSKLDDLNWVFKKTEDITDATLKAKVINALKNDLSKIEEAFDEDMVKKLFPADNTIRRTNYAEKLIENLDRAENFKRVFTVVN